VTVKSTRYRLSFPAVMKGLKYKQTADFLLRTEAGSRKEIETIVIDDGSEDRCCSFLEWKAPPYRKIRLLTHARVGAARARNLGAERARGTFSFFAMGTYLCRKAGLTHCVELSVTKRWMLYRRVSGPMTLPVRPGTAKPGDEKLEIRWLKRPSEIEPVALAPGLLGL